MENDKQFYELRSVEELHRFEASMMLGQTAVYLVSCGALLDAINKNDSSIIEIIALCIFGVILSLAFAIIIHRTGVNLRGARKRAEELSEELGFNLYSKGYRASSNSLFTGKSATKMICLCGMIYWLVVLLKYLFR